ncbi:hypothetical protein L1085_000645 [Streptomyces sp. MSC1_001]|jgi:hypothetical protein|uniref:hypothetical protein n=1 Tax=Streptomyces sp. MSC1_001 TaxID=2909263 RepID=UPI00202FAAC8|nr:hypothetical protein [Streptomyces sp. MSC1_001]
MSDQSIPTPRHNPRPLVEFTPVTNGLDYLVSAVKHLTDGSQPPDARDLKYAVLHLQAATEVLLKARLVKEHWSLVFAEPGAADLDAYTLGKFNSCTTDEALARLEKIARVHITKDNKDAIGKLKATRNALTHYGHTAAAQAVEAQAAAVLGFLLDFVHQDLRDEPGVHGTMNILRTKLRGIERLVRDRMNQLSETLEPLMPRTVQCGDCAQWAMVVGEENIRCLFCLREFGEGPAAAADYSWLIRGSEDNIAAPCKGCGTDASLIKAVVALEKERDSLICFTCGDLYLHQKRVVIPDVESWSAHDA